MTEIVTELSHFDDCVLGLCISQGMYFTALVFLIMLRTKP